MVALWENPTIWLSQEKQKILCIFVCSVRMFYEATCVCVAVSSGCCGMGTVWHACECIWHLAHI